MSGELFEWLVVAYIVVSTPLVIGALQFASFLALTITRLSLLTLSRRTRDRETGNST